MFVKPTSLSIRVPDPAYQGTPDYWLPPRGREVEDSLYWTRRLLDGDVELCTSPETLPSASPSPPAPTPAA